MEHAQEGSKAAERTEDPAIRRNATPSVTSETSALLGLQRAAGNRAVARMLAAPMKSRVQPPGRNESTGNPRPPINIQRHELDEAIKRAKQNESLDTVFYDKLVEKLLGGAAGGSLGGGSSGGSVEKMPDKTDLDKLEKELVEGEKLLTPEKLPKEQQDLLKRKKDLERRKAKLVYDQELKNAGDAAEALNPEGKSMDEMLTDSSGRKRMLM
jgi:hypothetical protein